MSLPCPKFSTFIFFRDGDESETHEAPDQGQRNTKPSRKHGISEGKTHAPSSTAELDDDDE